jgi:DtxR family Mn-dependent transcriptional regulator
MAVSVEERLGGSTEDYVKAIFKLEDERGAASTTSLAGRLGVSPAAVTKAVRALADKRLANHRPYRGVSLTAAGKKVALKVIRRHRLLERFLHDVLGYGWDEVDVEAERLEHHVSDAFIARIDRLLHYPGVDPHGDPIPSFQGTLTPQVEKPLVDCAEPGAVVVVRVRDGNPQVLRYLDSLGLRLGATIEIIEKQPFDGPFALRVHVGEETVDRTVGHELAKNVFVRSLETPDRKERNDDDADE